MNHKNSAGVNPAAVKSEGDVNAEREACEEERCARVGGSTGFRPV